MMESLEVDPMISDNVVKILTELYTGQSKELLFATISRPPEITVLRFNSKLITKDGALEKCKIFLKNQNNNSDLKANFHPMLKDVILIAANSFSSPQQKLEKEIIVDSACGSAVLRGADIFIPGVLAAHPGIHANDEVSIYVDIEKKCRKGLAKFCGDVARTGFGMPKFEDGKVEIAETKTTGIAIKMTNAIYNLPSFHHLDKTIFFPQNLPSIVTGHVLDVKEEDLVLDMCAAPGGKTTHIASFLGDKGHLVSIDKSPKKVEKIRENLEILNLSARVTCCCHDSTFLVNCQNEEKTTEKIKMEPPFPLCTFDKILLDPPCSGLGQRPQLRYVMADKELESYPILQRKLFKQAVQLLKSGGSLVYSTCTLFPRENEEQVAWALKSFPELRLIEQNPVLGRSGLHGYGLSHDDTFKLQRFDWMYTKKELDTSDIVTKSRIDTIGFFIAKFMKS